MSLFDCCPVCTNVVASGDPVCARCQWQLHSDYTLGHLTPADRARYDEQLQHARQQWRKHQQRHATERALAAAQAKLQHVQSACREAHRRPTVAPNASRSATVPLANGPPLTPVPSCSSPPTSRNPLLWVRRLWWSLFEPNRVADYRQHQEEK